MSWWPERRSRNLLPFEKGSVYVQFGGFSSGAHEHWSPSHVRTEPVNVIDLLSTKTCPPVGLSSLQLYHHPPKPGATVCLWTNLNPANQSKDNFGVIKYNSTVLGDSFARRAGFQNKSLNVTLSEYIPKYSHRYHFDRPNPYLVQVTTIGGGLAFGLCTNDVLHLTFSPKKKISQWIKLIKKENGYALQPSAAFIWLSSMNLMPRSDGNLNKNWSHTFLHVTLHTHS